MREGLIVPGTSALTVWHYDSPRGAAAGEVRLRDLQQRGHVTVVDAVTVTWVPGAHAPRVVHLRHRGLWARGPESVLGPLVAVLVADSTPGTIAAGPDLLASRLAGTGIERDFLADVRDGLVPGTSALLVLSSDADLDEIRLVIERGRARGDVRLEHAMLRDDAPHRLATVVRDLARRDA